MNHWIWEVFLKKIKGGEYPGELSLLDLCLSVTSWPIMPKSHPVLFSFLGKNFPDPGHEWLR